MTNQALTILRTLDRHLTGPGAVRLLGGAALILGYGHRRATEDADLLLDDQEIQVLIDSSNFGEALAATNAELEPLGLYITHIWGPEQQILTPSWREHCRNVPLNDLQRLTVSVLGPLDLVLSKLCRADAGDLDDIRFLLTTVRPSAQEVLSALESAVVPADFAEVFPGNADKVRAMAAELALSA